MTEKEHREEVAKARKIEPKYMMGTTAHHLLGDISRKNHDLFNTSAETDEYWVGTWITGFGFFNVLFPKSTSRELTKEEIEKYNKTYVQIGSMPPQKLKVD